MEQFYLGVDGGGSKTAAILADEQGRIIRQARLGPGNITVLDRGSASRLVKEILGALLQDELPSQLAFATFAMAGSGRVRARETFSTLLRRAGLKQFAIVTDAQIQYYSAFGEQSGILIAAGTGSVVLARNATGSFHQIGGWGYLLSDEGSGYDIGNRAIRQVLAEAAVKATRSGLTETIMHFFGLNEPQELVGEIYADPNPHRLIASCAQSVCEVAEQGDAACLALVKDAVATLLEMAVKASRFLPVGDQVKFTLSGGLLQTEGVLRRMFLELLEQSHPGWHFTEARFTPAAAALCYSLNAAGRTVPAELLQHLTEIAE